MPEKAIHEIPVRMHWYPPRFEPGAEPHRFAYEKETPLSNEYYRREQTPSGIKAPHVSGTAGHTHTDKTEEKMSGGGGSSGGSGGGVLVGVVGGTIVVLVAIALLNWMCESPRSSMPPATTTARPPAVVMEPAAVPPQVITGANQGRRIIAVCRPCADSSYRQDSRTCRCTRMIWRPGPPPAQVAGAARCAPCPGYHQDPDTCQCTRTRWHAGYH
jgi:hypothetical protein